VNTKAAIALSGNDTTINNTGISLLNALSELSQLCLFSLCLFYIKMNLSTEARASVLTPILTSLNFQIVYFLDVDRLSLLQLHSARTDVIPVN